MLTPSRLLACVGLTVILATAGCAEIAKIPGKVDGLPLPKDASDDNFQIIASLPGLESVEPRRDRRVFGYQQFQETAVWKNASLSLKRTSNTGRRYFVRSQEGTLQQVMLKQFGAKARDFDPLDSRRHRIGEVEYQQFVLAPGQRCLGLRAFDGDRPDEGFQGGTGINESLGRTVLQGYYCKRGTKAFDQRTVLRILDSVSAQGF